MPMIMTLGASILASFSDRLQLEKAVQVEMLQQGR